MKHYLLSAVFLLVILLISTSLIGQTARLDSLRQELGNSPHDSISCKLYLQIGDIYEHSQPDSALFYYDKSLVLARSSGLKKPQSVALRYMGIIFRNQGNYEKALEYYAQSLKIAEELQDKTLMASCYNSIGLVHRSRGSFRVARDYYMRSLAVFEETGNLRGMANSYNSIGIIYHSQGDYQGAIEHWLKTLKIYEDLNEAFGMSASYNNIGLVYYEQKNYERAIEFLNKALQAREKAGDKRGMAASFTNLGSVYYYMENYEKSAEYHRQALDISQELGDRTGIAAGYNNIGSIYRKQGNFNGALEQFRNALAIREEQEDRSNIALVYNSIANLYLDMAETQGQPQKNASLLWATEHGQYAYNIALEIGALPLQLASADILRKANTQLSRFRQALEFAEIYIAARDSMFNEEKTKAIAEIHTRFETEQKQQEIEKQQLIIERQEVENKRQLAQRNLFAWVSLLILLLACGVLAGYFIIRRKNQRLHEVNEMLTQSEKDLRRLLETKDKLYTIIAHDIKSPLAGLSGLCQLLHDDATDMAPDDISEYGKLIHESSQKLMCLIENMMHWARSQTGRILVKPRKIKLRKLSENVMGVLQLQADRKGIHLINDIPDNLRIFADDITISTVIRNLISNAIKFTGENGKVILGATHENGKVSISITDNGIGISAENLKKLFRIEKCFSTKGTFNETGTGLGLIVCKEFVEENQGSITVKSIPGLGTTFTLVLPAEKQKEPSLSLQADALTV